ncbi:hypothetical protein GCM10023196_093290 [Actinoallomurus vinaceus]|uniref:Uncharacterized protein n=1 Tax=Actinoallomurus vinaceus TaxID=1080074 RepID=A0ABP8URW6_9ACTN
MTKSPSPLPALHTNWIGGDIQGLSGLAQVLFNFAESSNGPVTDLNHAVNRLVGNQPSYKGAAAGEFKDKFSQDMTDINWLSQRATSIGDIVDHLALALAKLEAWLEKIAERGVAARYVAIDQSGNMSFPKGTSNPEVQKFIQDFNQRREEALALAKKARRAAAQQLSAEYRALSAGMKNYRDNHKDLLSKNEISALGSWVSKLDSQSGYFNPKTGTKEHLVHAAAGAGIGATVGAVIGGGVGGAIGLLGGPAAEVTVPATAVAGAAAGNAIGASVGGLVGGIVGWAW